MRGARTTSVFAALAALAALVSGCATAGAGAVSDYDAALAPLKARSDVLEKRFAAVQAKGVAQPDRLHDALAKIIPEYAELLDRTRGIDVEDPDLRLAHHALLASLDTQQEGLRLALDALERDDPALMADAASALEEAKRLRDEHRRLLAKAR